MLDYWSSDMLPMARTDLARRVGLQVTRIQGIVLMSTPMSDDPFHFPEESGVDVITCPMCGHRLVSTMTECPACGERISSGAERTTPTYALYSNGTIVLATFLGSLIAGGLLLAINLRRLGHSNTARNVLVLSVTFMVGFFAFMSLLPDDLNIPNLLFTIPQMFAIHWAAKKFQGSALEEHTTAGGRTASTWGAVGIAVGIAILLAGLLVAIGLAIEFLTGGL